MVFVTGDTHGDPNRLSKNILKNLNEGDTLIVCGDFGFIWDRSKAEQKILKAFSKSTPVIRSCPNYKLRSALFKIF